jgi:alkylhydroperoxidase/carboxymuconolactone decarboxylase family protein YurZ
MAESQLKLNEERKALLQKLVELRPELAVPLKAASDEVYKDGALSSKTKRLMALAIALGVGCTNCELGQTMNALDLDATTEELLETIGVVISMRGTTGLAESLRVIRILDELGKL